MSRKEELDVEFVEALITVAMLLYTPLLIAEILNKGENHGWHVAYYFSLCFTVGFPSHSLNLLCLQARQRWETCMMRNILLREGWALTVANGMRGEIMGFTYRTCLTCRYRKICCRGLNDYGDPWKYAEHCDLFKPRKLSLLDKIIIIAAWLLRWLNDG